jgi:hypothetical protein
MLPAGSLGFAIAVRQEVTAIEEKSFEETLELRGLS